jgi:CBS domain-containing protein
MKSVRQLLSAKGAAIYTIGPEASVLDALRILAERNIGALLVVDGPRVVGIVSERDYARKVILLGRVSRDTPVFEIMTREIVFVGPDDSVETCMALMTARHIRHLPVLEESRLVGVISIGDVVKSIMDDQQFRLEQLERYLMS